MPKEKLFLIDGMSHVYRAFFAFDRRLATSKGLPTNAIFGFAMVLRKLINEEKPDYICAAFDSAEPTFRHEAYEEYKANRQAIPEDLVVQLPFIFRLCDALGVPILRIGGYEADDIIGTLARQAEKMGLTSIIVSNDKDMCQLVSDDILILRTDKTASVYLDAKGVEERLGVRPDQVIDLLALRGDSSDNIPGAPGIGEKGALQIIQQFGTLDAALASYEQVQRKAYRDSLRDNVDIIQQSRELATIKTDIPLNIDIESLRYRGPNPEIAYQLFTELEFASLLREFATTEPAPASAPSAAVRQQRNYRVIKTQSELEKFAAAVWASERIALSVGESDGVVKGIAISLSHNNATYIDFSNFEPGGAPLQLVRDILENGIIRKAAYDFKGILTALNCKPNSLQSDSGGLFDQSAESDIEIDIEGIEDDIMLAAYLLNPNRGNYKLSDVVREYLGFEFEPVVDGFDPAASAALQAADFAIQLADALRKRIEEAELEKVYDEIEIPLVKVLFEMERAGVRIDTNALAEISVEIDRELASLTQKIYELAGEEFNINSTQQLGEVFEKLNFVTAKRTKTGRISTSADVLEELAATYELPRLIIDYRELSKLKGTYVDALPKLINPRTGRVHTTFNQAVTATGRLSASSPNLQNIPIRTEMGRRIRRAFVPDEGCLLISADYSQIELRLLAHITGDEVMRDAFLKGEDIHARTAREVFGARTDEEMKRVRRLAKITNFGIAYGIEAFGLAQRAGITRKEAKQAIENYYATYKGVRRYMEETPEKARRTGLVRTLLGRLRQIPDIGSKNHNLRARAEREAINSPIQGASADIIKMAMIQVDRALKRERMKSRMILQVHDELVLEAPIAEAERVAVLVKNIMENVYPLDVPLVVDVGVGKNWMEAK